MYLPLKESHHLINSVASHKQSHFGSIVYYEEVAVAPFPSHPTLWKESSRPSLSLTLSLSIYILKFDYNWLCNHKPYSSKSFLLWYKKFEIEYVSQILGQVCSSSLSAGYSGYDFQACRWPGDKHRNEGKRWTLNTDRPAFEFCHHHLLSINLCKRLCI